MNILMVTGFYLSGQTTHIVELATELARLGHVVTIYTSGKGHAQAWKLYNERLSEEGIVCRRGDQHFDALAWARELNVDVIHCHSSDLLATSLQLARRLGAPAVYTAHGLNVARYCPVVSEADWVIGVGPRVVADLRNHGVQRVSLIGNGVDVRRFIPRDKEASPAIAFVGRVDATKRRSLWRLIEAVQGIPRATLHIAANERPRADRCVAHGWLRDVDSLLSRCHVVAGTGRAIREGMASGCVGLVLGERYGGLVLPGALRGKSFPAFASQEGAEAKTSQIACDLIRLFQQPKRLAELGRWSADYARRNFSLVSMARKTLAVYDQAMSRRIAL